MSGMQIYPSNSPRPQQVDWGNISEAFEIVKAHWQPFVIYSVIAVIGTYAINFLVQIPFQVLVTVGTTAESAAAAGGLVAGGILLYIISMIVSMATTAIAYSGIFALGIKVLSGGKPELGDGIAAFGKLGPVAIAGVLGSLIAIPGLCACGIGYIFIYAMMSFAPIIILHERLSAIDALKRSYELTKPHWLMFGAYFLVISIIAGLGVIACCVGIFFTYPLAATAILLAYRDLSGMTFGEPVAAGATPYPREGSGGMPSYTGPADSGELKPDAEPSPEPSPSDAPDAGGDGDSTGGDGGSSDSSDS